MNIKLKISQAGEPVLRDAARPLSSQEIKSSSIQQLIPVMRETMHDAKGVGLAAPQIGLPLQLVVIEDRADNLPQEALAERARAPVPFQVIINPQLSVLGDVTAEFFEGCLSVAGFTGLVPRAFSVRVECLNERAEAIEIVAHGWYARILQHEIDHLNGTLYLDRMKTRSYMSHENFNNHWKDKSIAQVKEELKLSLYNQS